MLELFHRYRLEEFDRDDPLPPLSQFFDVLDRDELALPQDASPVT
jgi:hypothetical protein